MCCLFICYTNNNSDTSDNSFKNTNVVTNANTKESKKNKVQKNAENAEYASNDKPKEMKKKLSFEYLKKTLSDIRLDNYIYKNRDRWIN